MNRPLIPTLCFGLFTIAISNGAKAEGVLDSIELSGLFEAELSVGTATDNVQKAEFILTPEMGIELSPATRLTIIGRLRGDIVDELEPGQPAQPNRSDISKRWIVNDHVDVELHVFARLRLVPLERERRPGAAGLDRYHRRQ